MFNLKYVYALVITPLVLLLMGLTINDRSDNHSNNIYRIGRFFSEFLLRLAGINRGVNFMCVDFRVMRKYLTQCILTF